MGSDMVSAAIVTYNSEGKAVNAFKSILKETKRYPLIFYAIDNNSTDKTREEISGIDGVTLIESGGNIGFGAAHNKVLGETLGKYHFVINPDITVDSDVISDAVDFMEENPDVVMMMPKILNSDGTEQFLPKEIPTFKRIFLGRIFKGIRDEYTRKNKQQEQIEEIDCCTGCFFCIRSDAFGKLNGFDNRYFMYLEDADLTLRAKKYGKVVMNRGLSVTHEWERTSAKNLKYLMIHTKSAFKFLLQKGKILNENSNNRM